MDGRCLAGSPTITSIGHRRFVEKFERFIDPNSHRANFIKGGSFG